MANENAGDDKGDTSSDPKSKLGISIGPLSDEKIEEIQRCLEKGILKIEITDASADGTVGASWLYD